METAIRRLSSEEFPSLLYEIPDPPKTLYAQGNLPPPHLKLLAVVGSRNYSSYGKQVIEYLLPKLAPYPVGIVSGLALGVDALAHETALTNHLYTLAVPGSGLAPQVLRPATNRDLAERILKNGGGLLTEYAPETEAAPWTFPKRNRIMAGLCHATLLIEASEKSGTLITARLTVDYNRELLAVPGNIFSKNSYGVHQFLKLGATLVTDFTDILSALQLEEKELVKKPTPVPSSAEQKVLSLLTEPRERNELIHRLELPITEANILLMQMEMAGLIRYEPPYYYTHI